MTWGCKGPTFIPDETCRQVWTMTLGRACPLSLPGCPWLSLGMSLSVFTWVSTGGFLKVANRFLSPVCVGFLDHGCCEWWRVASFSRVRHGPGRGRRWADRTAWSSPRCPPGGKGFCVHHLRMLRPKSGASPDEGHSWTDVEAARWIVLASRGACGDLPVVRFWFCWVSAFESWDTCQHPPVACLWWYIQMFSFPFSFSPCP